MMSAFRDRERATEAINTLLSEQTAPWIIVSGQSRIGKTEFVKKVAAGDPKTVLCEPTCSNQHAYVLIKSILPERQKLKEIICIYAERKPKAQKILASVGIQYIYALQEQQVDEALKRLIMEDISSGQYTFAQFLTESILPRIHCIILDNFHWCDFESYKWILEFCQPALHVKVIAVCNFTLPWESEKLRTYFQAITSPVDLSRFDSEEAYFEILRDNFMVENEVSLRDTARKLFKLYNGDSQLLFETIKLAKRNSELPEYSNVIQNNILDMAQQVHLKKFDELTPTLLLVLHLLAVSPVPLTKKCILDMVELYDPIGSEIITKLYDSRFIVQDVDKSGQTLYCIQDEFIREISMDGLSVREQRLCETKILRAIEKGSISATTEQTLDFALRLGHDSISGLLQKVISTPDEEVSCEKKAMYLNRFLEDGYSIPTTLLSLHTAQLLYDFGYYFSANQVLTMLTQNREQVDYKYLMLLGDTQHLLLSSKASETYKRAASIKDIDISERLMAINRQIMALNQEHQEETAKELYQQVLHNYADVECLGLVELYRNTNNSFEYQEAIDYTAKGYYLAKKLDDEVETYKCLHNLCMIQLQYGHYEKPFDENPLDLEPTFELVLNFFSTGPQYRHEQAYPLLDLGTVEMFKYANDSLPEHLSKAKQMYSTAQLYAKSFYAQHIAETGLLIVNSYLYADQDLSYVERLRKAQYERYQAAKGEIADYRVHRKILLTLALSAIIGSSLQEATEYLQYANPYVLGPETLRYNKLCERANCAKLEKEPVSLEGKYEIYYGSDRFVPWLISFGH